ncbi:MAG: class II aldolase/adducin family protein [Candidatus Hydrogenedentes bacterium]|nr:class II aldolase/adducin family protein [Candidatus Hydrogenedentota bacterium]
MSVYSNPNPAPARALKEPQSMDPVLTELIDMSHYLGDPARGYAILGEGNSSARIDENSFYVKASGTTMADIDEHGFVKVSIPKVTSILDDPDAGDDDVSRVFKESLLEPGETRRPSVEAMLHAILLQVPEFRFIGHTHPAYTNMVLCSSKAEEVATGRLFPDHIVSLGHKSVYVPYVDPGLVLAREVRKRFEAFVAEEGVLPKAIFMQNHGLITMGSSPKAVTSCTDMAEKASQVAVGAYAMGGPRYMAPHEVERIFTRPDEAYRLKSIADTE